jgi:hypothetical protein
MVHVKSEGWTENPKILSNAFRNATPAALEASAKVKKGDFIKEEKELDDWRKARAEQIKE